MFTGPKNYSSCQFELPHQSLRQCDILLWFYHLSLSLSLVVIVVIIALVVVIVVGVVVIVIVVAVAVVDIVVNVKLPHFSDLLSRVIF